MLNIHTPGIVINAFKQYSNKTEDDAVISEPSLGQNGHRIVQITNNKQQQQQLRRRNPLWLAMPRAGSSGITRL